MAKTPEDDLPVDDAYMRLLRDEILGEHGLGRDRVAKAADINPVTVWRNVSEGNLTYTTARKLRDAIAALHREDKTQPSRPIPPPFVAVVSQSHYELCTAAAKLHELDYDAFGEVLELALQRYRDAVIGQANQRIAHPIRTDTDDD